MASAGEIVGRGTELAAVDAFLAGPAPAALILEGPAGCGKTTVWEHALAADGHRSLVARPTDAESTLSLSTVADLLGAVELDALAALPGPQRRALRAALLLDEPTDDAPPDPRVLGVAFLTVIRELATASPVLVAVDDVQWADAASAAIMGFAARRLRDEPVRLLFALRRAPGVSSPVLDAVPHATRVPIGAMDESELRALLGRRATTLLPAVVRAIHERSGGNPFYALELARALERAPERGAGEDLPLPPSLHDLVRERLAALPRRTREALLATALLGDPRLEVLARIDDLDVLEPALAEDIVRLDDDRARFTHPLLAAGARAEASPLAERRMHERLAGVVADPEACARHRAHAVAGPDAAVARELDDVAARAEARGDQYAVAELAALALRLSPTDDPRLFGRLMRAGSAAMIIGRTRQAHELARAASERAASPAEACDALRFLAETEESTMEVALALYERAIEAAGDDLGRLVRVRGEHSAMLFITGRCEAALREATAVIALAERLGDPEWLAVALSVHGYMARAMGRAALREQLDRAVAIAPHTRLGVFGRGPAVNRAVCLVYDDRLDEGRDVFEDIAAGARERGDELLLAQALFQLGELECRAGRYERAEEHAREAMAYGEENRQDRSATLYVLAWAEACMGRAEDARVHAREGARLSREIDDQLFWAQNEAVLGFLELSLGDAAAADRHLRPLWPAVTALGYGEPSVWPVLPNEIEALIDLGELTPATAFLVELEERGRALDSPWALSQAARCRGLLLAATGAPEEALAAFAAALVEHRRMSGAFERARTLLAQGRTLRRMKRRREAREALQAALAIFEELGTPLWAAQAREALARIGGRAPGRDALTPTEQRVAALVAEGRTNREVATALFVTVRTVEANLTRVYAKLGVRSRAELARRLASGSPPFR